MNHAALAQAFLDRAVDALARNGFSLRLDHNLYSWRHYVREVMRDHPKTAMIASTTFDPDHSTFTKAHCYWIEVEDTALQRVGCIACRMFSTDDYLQLVRSQRLWSDKDFEFKREAVRLIAPSLPLLSGMIGHHGGLWIEPEFRRNGLSVFLPRICRALSIRQWAVDWHCGSVLDHLVARGVPTRKYGYPHCVPLIDGYLPHMQQEGKLWLTYISQEEMLQQLSEETEILDAHGNKNLVDLAKLFAERQGQAGVTSPSPITSTPD